MLLLTESLIYSIAEECYKLTFLYVDETQGEKVGELQSYLKNGEIKNEKTKFDVDTCSKIRESNLYKKKIKEAKEFTRELEKLKESFVNCEVDIVEEKYMMYLHPSIQFTVKNFDHLRFEIEFKDRKKSRLLIGYKSEEMEIHHNPEFEQLYREIAFWMFHKGKYRLRLLVN